MLCGGTRRFCAGYLCFCPFRAWMQGSACPQGVAPLALGYVLAGLSARSWLMDGRGEFMLLPFQGVGARGRGTPGCRFACPGLCACWAFSPLLANGWAWRIYAFALSGRGCKGARDPRVSLRLPWAMCLLGFQPALCIWHGCGYNRGRVGFAPYLCAVWVLSPLPCILSDGKNGKSPQHEPRAAGISAFVCQ